MFRQDRARGAGGYTSVGLPFKTVVEVCRSQRGVTCPAGRYQWTVVTVVDEKRSGYAANF